jgi:uncharacterized protein YceK
VDRPVSSRGPSFVFSNEAVQMMAAAAFILGISLIFMGVVIIGSSVGWWDVQDDVWGWIIAVLATVSRWVSAKVNRSTSVPDDSLNGEKTAKTTALLVVFMLALSGCASMSAQTKASFASYGTCVGARAIDCAASSQGHDLESKAISFSACMAGGAILCVSTATAASNPPGISGGSTVDLVCLDAAFKQCYRSADVKECTGTHAASCVQ